MSDIEFPIDRGYESKEFDYKCAFKWEKISNDKIALVKDVLAMANTIGGDIVIGVSEPEPGTFQFDGLSDDQFISFETTKVNQLVQKYAEPPINTTMLKGEHKGKKYVVLRVPEFANTPHVCKEEFKTDAKLVLRARALYIRTDNNESAEILSVSDVNALIERALKKRADLLFSTMERVLQGRESSQANKVIERDVRPFLEKTRAEFQSENPYKELNRAYREVAFYLKIEKDLPFKTIKEMLLRCSKSFRGWPILFIAESRPDYYRTTEDGLLGMIKANDVMFGKGFQYWHADSFGDVIIKEELWEDRHSDAVGNSRYVSYENVVYSVIEAIQCMVDYYENSIDDNEEATLILKLENIKGRKFFHNSGYWFPNGIEIMADQITCKKTYHLYKWRADKVYIAVQISKYFLERLGDLEVPEEYLKEQTQNLLNRQIR